jgi:DNA gyrase subunit A
MGLVAAGVNGMKLDDKDEVVGVVVLSGDEAPTDGEVFLLTNDGKAKRVEEKDFPIQGRYGKGVIAWELSDKIKLVGVVADKPNHMATIHLSRGAPKSTRLDAAGLRKRAATKGDVVVEVKPGEEVVSVNVAWTAEKFVAEPKAEKPKALAKKTKPAKKSAATKTKSPKGKKIASKKKTKKAPPKKKTAPRKASKPAKKKK